MSVEITVPGRLCLFGEHSDWAGGMRAAWPSLSPGACIACGTDQGLTVRAAPLSAEVRLSWVVEGDGRSAAPPPLTLPAQVGALSAAAAAGGFWSYAAGTLAEVIAAHPQVRGLDLACVAMDLPMKKGLSSSAATCVATARAASAAFQLDLSDAQVMELAYRGELRTPSRCGRLDQVCALGRRISWMGFDGDALTLEPVPVGAPLHLLIVDLGGAKDTVRILADLQACFPDAAGPVAAGVRRALGAEGLSLTRAARQAIASGDAPTLGRLMTEAQALFDAQVAPACPSELRAPRLHGLLEHRPLAPLIYGGKGVGSQGDGTAQLLTRGPDARRRAQATLAADLGMMSWPLTLEPEPGA